MEGHPSSPSLSKTSPTNNSLPSRSAAPETTKSPITSKRPLNSSKVSDQKSRPAASAASDNNSGTSSTPSQAIRQAAPQLQAWTGAKNPITGRSQTPRTNSTTSNKQDPTATSQGQRSLNMPQQKKTPNPTDMSNGSARRDNTSNFQRKDSGDARVQSNNNGRSANGSRTGFRTDTNISNSGPAMGRELKRWDAPPEAKNSGKNMSLEGSGGAPWDQFSVNEQLFGLKTDYDDSIYTTDIDRAHPNFQQRQAMADRLAREIQSSAPVTAHQAEERVMDHAGGADDTNEEDKYSGVRRVDFPPLQNRENKYTPPARRAPTGHTTVKGAPVDPAILHSQLKAPTPKQPISKSEENKLPAGPTKPSTIPSSIPGLKVAEAKPDARPESKANDLASPSAKLEEVSTKGPAITPLQPSGTTSRTISPQANQGNNTPVAPSHNVEQSVLTSFKSFARGERIIQEKARTSRIRQDKEVKLNDLKKFGAEFKLSSPVPPDLISIIAKDPEKQKAIQEKALRDAQELAKAAKAKAEQEASAAAVKQKQPSVAKEIPQAKVPTEPTTSTTTTPAPAVDTRTSRPTAPQHSSSPSAVPAPGRNTSGRQSYGQQTHYQQTYRNNRQNSQYGGQQAPQTGNLAQRIREKQMHQPQHPHMNPHMPVDNMRLPPTGPANNIAFDATYGARRLSGLPPSHLQARLNPNSNEFKPNAPVFNPAGPSQASSPRSAINVVEPHPVARTPPAPGQLIRRKTKAVDPNKCNIMSFLKTLKPLKPPGGAPSHDENLGLRPAFTFPVTWRQISDEQLEKEKPDSTMRLTYKEFFARQRASATAAANPNPQHGAPGMAHHHQLPLHLQGAAHLAPRQSPHMAPMQMHNGAHGPMPPVPYTNHPDDNRMMHSNSAQSFASPRMATQMPMAYPPNMNSPAPMQYAQPVVQPYMPNGGPPPMQANFRSLSHNPQYGMHQQHTMGPQVMYQPQYMPQQGMGPAPQQVPMYNGAPGQFMPPGPIPPPSVAGSNGFPSPGRQAAPMMAHQGSHQGQPMMYGVSPGMQYQQPYPAHQPPKYQGQRP